MQRHFKIQPLLEAKQIQAVIKNKKIKQNIYSSLSDIFSLRDTTIVYTILLVFENKLRHENESLRHSLKLRAWEVEKIGYSRVIQGIRNLSYVCARSRMESFTSHVVDTEG